jgi:hypothetical protein
VPAGVVEGDPVRRGVEGDDGGEIGEGTDISSRTSAMAGAGNGGDWASYASTITSSIRSSSVEQSNTLRRFVGDANNTGGCGGGLFLFGDVLTWGGVSSWTLEGPCTMSLDGVGVNDMRNGMLDGGFRVRVAVLGFCRLRRKIGQSGDQRCAL